MDLSEEERQHEKTGIENPALDNDVTMTTASSEMRIGKAG